MKKTKTPEYTAKRNNYFERIHWEQVLLMFLFLIALFLRVYKLGTVVAGFHVDELNAGYIGRYILTHGKDFFGQVFPLSFNKFGDFRPTGIFYLSGLSTFLFGISETAVRLPSAFFGALTVFPSFFLAQKISGRKIIGFCTAGVLVISPWHIVLSRATSESIVGLFFVLSGLALLITAIETSSRKTVLVSILCFFVPYLFYHPYRLITPLLIGFITLLAKKTPLRKTLWFITALFLVITASYSLTQVGVGRFEQVAFYKNPDMPTFMLSFVKTDNSKPFANIRMGYNKTLLWGREFVKQYGSYFTADYLFLSGGLPDRYKVPEQGLLEIVFIPMMILGFILTIWSSENRKWKPFILVFLFLAPIPAALTYEDAPNVQRSIGLLFPFLFFIGTGLATTLQWLTQKKRYFVFGILYTGLILFEVTLFWRLYMQYASLYKSIYRNEGNRELFSLVKKDYSKYDRILLPVYDELPMYASFYFKKFDTFPSIIYRTSPPEISIEKLTFVPNRCPLNLKKPGMNKTLFINYDDCPETTGVKTVSNIRRSDGTTAYIVYESE